MTMLCKEITGLIDASERDLGRIERTLTDGYAEALTLEAEKRRIERRITEVVHGLKEGDTEEKATELTKLAHRLDGNAGDLVRLRSALADLRRHAASVR
jgi:uncharacterized membrane-anchored protein